MSTLEVTEGERGQLSSQGHGHSRVSRLISSRESRIMAAIQLAEDKHQQEVSSLAFCTYLFDTSPDLWRKMVVEGVTDELIITKTIPSLLKKLYKEETRSIGMTVYYFQNIEAPNQYPEVQLGWYQFSGLDPIYQDVPQPKKFGIFKQPDKQDFLHFFPKQHGLTEKGEMIIDIFSQISHGKTLEEARKQANDNFRRMFASK